MTRSSSIAVLLVLASCPALTERARGQAQVPPAGDREARAKALFLEGKDRYRQQSYVGALARFLEALRLARRSSPLLMVAHCYRRLELPDEALIHYQHYEAAWERENPGQPSPHREVVAGHIERLTRTVREVKRGEAMMRRGDARSALAVLEAEYRQVRWPRIQLDIGLCYRNLGRRGEARRAIQAAIEYWEQQQTAWKLEGFAGSPEHARVQRELAQLRRLEQQKKEDEAPAYEPPVETPPPAPRRSTLWLVTGISAAALAVGFEVLAWASYAKGNDTWADDPALGRYRAMTIAGHVMAGAMAVLSGVSLYLYARSGKPRRVEKHGLVVLPADGGIWIGGAVRF